MVQFICTLLTVFSVSAFAQEASAKETVQVSGAAGKGFADGTEVATLKEACALANEVADNQAMEACLSLDGKYLKTSRKIVSPVVNLGGHSGSCRVSVDIDCEVSF